MASPACMRMQPGMPPGIMPFRNRPLTSCCWCQHVQPDFPFPSLGACGVRDGPGIKSGRCLVGRYSDVPSSSLTFADSVGLLLAGRPWKAEAPTLPRPCMKEETATATLSARLVAQEVSRVWQTPLGLATRSRCCLMWPVTSRCVAGKQEEIRGGAR